MNKDTWNLDYGPLQGLYRDRENGWIFGVCAGLAEYFGLDPTVVRVASVLLSLGSLGTGALVYVVLWCVIPEREYY